MIKLVFCLRRLPALSVSEFQSYWFDSHAGLVRHHADALRIRRYTQSHTFTDPRLSPVSDVRGGRVDPFDGWLANSPMFLPKEHVVIRTDRALGPVWCVPCVRRVPASARVNGREQVMVCRDDGQPSLG